MPTRLSLIAILLFVAGFFLFFSFNQKGAEKDTPVSPPSANETTLPVFSTEPPPPHIESASGVSFDTLPAISFFFTPAFIPPILNVYKFAEPPIEREDAQAMAEKLGFTSSPALFSSPDEKNILVWKDGDKDFTIFSTNGMSEYVSPSQINNSLDTIESKQNAAIIAARFLREKVGLENFYSGAETRVTLYRGVSLDLQETASLSEASVFEVSFLGKVESFPLYQQYGNDVQAQVWIERNASITRASIHYPPILLSQQPHSTLTFEEAKQKIQGGEGTIVAYGDTGLLDIAPTPTRISFSSMRVGYLQDKTNYILYPIFVFSGTAFTQEGDQSIMIYLPATK